MGGALVGVDRSVGRSMAPPNRGKLEPGRTTLLAEMWVVKAQNAARNQPPAGQRSRDRLSSQLRLRVEIGGRPLMIPATAASAIRRATSWSAQDAPRTRRSQPEPLAS